MGEKEWRYYCLDSEEWRFKVEERRIILKLVIILSNIIAAISNLKSPANIAGDTMISWLLLFALTWASEFSNDRSTYKLSRVELFSKSRLWNLWVRYIILSVSFIGGVYILFTGVLWVFYSTPPRLLNSVAVTGALFAVAIVKALGTIKDIHLVSGRYIPAKRPSNWAGGLPPGARN